MTLNEIFPRTSEFNRFVAPAHDKAELWRFLLGFLIIIAIYLGWVVGGYVLIDTFGSSALRNEVFEDLGTGLSRKTLALTLLSFFGVFIGVGCAVPILHRRNPLSILGAKKGFRRGFLSALVVFMAVSTVFILPVLILDGTVPQHSFGSVVAFLPLAALLVLIQTSAEEVLFRGYLMQQLAARFKSPWVWLVFPSCLFGILHYDATFGAAHAIGTVLAITLSGLLWADLVRVTGSLGAAVGWHFANNFLLMNFIGYNDMLNGFAWRLFNFGYADAPLYMYFLDPLIAVVTWAILRRIAAKQHN